MGYILAGSLTRLNTLVYEINGAEYMYMKGYIKHKWGIKSRRYTIKHRLIPNMILDKMSDMPNSDNPE